MMTAKTLKRWYIWHRWSSLIVTPFLLVLCLTGLILIFHHEIDHLLGVVPEANLRATQPATLADLVAKAQAERRDREPKYVFIEEDAPNTVFVGMGAKGDSDSARAHALVYDLRSGEKLAAYDPRSTFTGVVFRLHANLLLGLPGELFIGAVGIGFFIALITGAVVYGPFMKRAIFGVVRRGQGCRLLHADLHNLAGIAILGWCSVVAATGILLSVGSLVLKYYQATDLAAMVAPFEGKPAPAQLVTLDMAAKRAEAAWPGHRFRSVLFPGTNLAGRHHYAFFMTRERGFDSRVFKLAMVDAATGELTVATQAPVYIKALLVSQPLHFGDYAGLPLKVLWSVFTLLTTLITANGVYLWWIGRRRRDPRGDEVPARITELHGLGA
jgi:uncharacterized iron-regulated membrane protein